ncbi:MAG: hypothetical protein WCC36_04270 [Gammaproteobacteria bacterium]
MTRLSGLVYGDAATAQVGKVAATTLSFWILKIVVTTVGDLSGDLLSITLGLGYLVSLFVALAFVLSLLTVQFRAVRFNPLVYWTLILGTSTLGAELSDTMDRALHLGYIVGALALLACLVAILAGWRVRRGRIGFYPIVERQEELLYWMAVIFANSLGSVLGDLIGDRLGLGIIGGAAINAGVIATLLLLHYATRANKALLFWTAFVFTRA